MPKKRTPKKEEGKLPRDLIALAIMAAGLFSLLSVFNLGTGKFGQMVADFIFGVFGLMGYAAPVATIVAGWLMMISYKKHIHIGKIALVGTLAAMAVVFAQMFGHARIVATLAEMDRDGFFTYMLASMEDGRAGGIVGGLLCWPMTHFLGVGGSWILSLTATVGCVALLAKFSLGDASRKLADKTKDLYNERVAARAERPAQEVSAPRERPRGTVREFHNEVIKKPRKGGKSLEPDVYEFAADAARSGGNLSLYTPDDREEDRPEELAGVLNPIGDEADLEPRQEETVEETVEEIKEIEEAAEEKEEEDLEKHAVNAAPLVAKPYHFPPMGLLSLPPRSDDQSAKARKEQQERSVLLIDTLASFGIEAQVVGVSRGPALTRYELKPAAGVKVSRITGLADDIALNMAAMGVRIEAPIPGKAAIGIEVPNIEVSTVSLREVLQSDDFRNHPSRLAFALGKDIAGKPIVADLARMPHVLIAGATGSGKSVCINSLVASILYKATPEEVKLIMIDPKVVELSVYNGIPHLLVPVVTDPKKAAGALNWAVMEMTDRYKKFAETGCRDLKGYNEYAREHEMDPLAQLVVIIDELADLMMVASRDVEDAICRLAQLARAAGIHLVIATQRPSVNVITGVIKANIPSRIAFSVASQVDSRTILDMAGAEKLLGRGDMLYDPSGANKALRVQGCFITDSEVNKLVETVKGVREAEYDPDLVETMEKTEGQNSGSSPGGYDEEEGVDDLLAQAIELAVDTGTVSTSMIQRRFRVGYARAGRLIDEMEQRGIISGQEGSKPRTTLISREEFVRQFGAGAP